MRGRRARSSGGLSTTARRRMVIVASVRQARNPRSIHAPLAGYRHQIELRGQDRLLVLSGQIGMAPDGHIPDDPAEQLERRGVRVHVRIAGASMGYVPARARHQTRFGWGCWHSDIGRAARQKTALVEPGARA